MKILKHSPVRSIFSYVVIAVCLFNLGCKKVPERELSSLVEETTPSLFSISAVNTSFDYVIQKSGSTIYGKDVNGKVVYSNRSFNQVLNNLFSRLKTGGTILIRGRYTGISLITVPYHNITIKGEGKTLTSLKLKDRADAGFSNVDRLGMFAVNGVDNFQISDLELDGNGSKQVYINNGTYLNGLGYLSALHIGAFRKSSKNTLVKNLYIHDFSMTGVYEEVDGLNTKVIDTEFARCYWNGITFNGTYSEATNCKISGSGDVGISLYGTNCVLTKCRVEKMDGMFGSNNARWGIGIEKQIKESSGHRIIDCEVDGGPLYNLNSGFAVVDGMNIYVENLRVKNASIFGVNLDGAINVAVVNSDIQCAPQGFAQGVIIKTSMLGVNSSGNKINNNIIRANGFGINIVNKQQKNTTLSYNVFAGPVQRSIVDNGTGTVSYGNIVNGAL